MERHAINQGDNTDSEFLSHTQCESCGSSDARAVYSDGHSFCFSCQEHQASPKKFNPPVVMNKEIRLLNVEYGDIPKRKIREDTCRKYSYGFSDQHQVATYRDESGTPIAQKLRDRNKNFTIVGDAKAMTLYGQHLWRGGKQLVICEGEIDTLSFAQVQSLKWPVVGVPNGAQSAAKSVKKNIEFIERFEKVIFMFDMDEPGQAAARECAEVVSPGKAYIAQLPGGYKDVNEMLVDGKTAELVSAMWSAMPHRPDGLAFKDDIYKAVTEDRDVSNELYPWDGWNRTTYGIRRGELVTITAGTGIGKSSICREIAYRLSRNSKVAYIALEENVRQSALQFLGIHTHKPLHLKFDLSEEEMSVAFEEVFGGDSIVLYDHFGSIEPSHLISKIKFLAYQGYHYVFLDHITLMLSGPGEQGDERRRIDAVMTRLRQAVENLNICLFVVSHLRRTEGRPTEEGGRTSLSLLRGSTQIAALSDICIGLERDQQDNESPNTLVCRCLKNRFSGDTGVMSTLTFCKNTMSFQTEPPMEF